MPSNVEDPVWIIEVKQVMGDKDDEGLDRPPCIFTVPKTLKYVRPEAYEPQLLALGPYHRWREDLYEMERFKILTTKKCQTYFPHVKFNDIITALALHEPRIRARYDKYLKMNGIELAWIMAIDGQFLLQFLFTFGGENGQESVLNLSPRLSCLVDSKGRKKPGYDCLVKDVMMLENQVPINVLKKMLEIQCKDVDFGLNLLANIYLDICKKTSPFLIRAEHPLDGSALKKRGHLLGFFYSLINRMWDQEVELDQAKAFEIEAEEDGGGGDGSKQKCGCFSRVGHRSPATVFSDLWEHLSGLSFFKEGPLKVVGVVKDLVSKVVPNFSGEDGKDSSETEKIVQVEEIVIPSVSSLIKQGIEFKPTTGGLFSISFDNSTLTFNLPVVKLDVNSEVIIRNLVAYEALAISGPLVLARYAELMNGIVDTEEDVKLLKNRGIIESELKNEEVAELWNGMSKCIRLTRVEFIEEAIASVNKQYNGIRTVKLARICKSYVYGSWRMLVFFATLIIIGLMCLQSFCSVYNCPRFFHLESAKA